MNPKFIISGGGTGGHIFPAVAIAKELQLQYPNAEFLFVGALGRMEMEKIPLEGFKIVGLKVSGLKRAISIKNISVISQFIQSYFKAKKIIKQFNPNCVIGTGGYASLATLYAAANLKYKTLIWEGNGFAGLTNKILAKKVNVICCGFANMEKFFPVNKIIHTGNPVRSEFLNLPTKTVALDFFQLSNTKKTVFVTGGSLGARTINQAIENGLQQLVEKNIQLIWQTGKNFESKHSHNNSFKIVQFLREMNMAYAACDLVISRAGALSVSEIAVVNKPAILIPSPNVTEDHQTQNAMQLTHYDAAVLLKDKEVSEQLINVIIDMAQNNELLNNIKSNLQNLAKPYATKEIVDQVIKLINE